MSPTVDGVRIDPSQVGEGELTQEQLIAKENILDHYRKPRNKRAIEHPSGRAKDKNPLCGDELEVFVAVENGTIKDISFQGHGCAISQASMSMLSRRLVGKTIEQARALGQDDVLAMLGIPIGIVRRKCAMLGLRVSQQALNAIKVKT